MARIAMVFGILLGILGIVYFVLTGSSHPTALIPLWFGVALVLCGVLANTPDAKKRMLWMHVAVTIGLLGFLFPGIRGSMELAKAHAQPGVAGHPAAVQEQLLMALVCLIFVVLCVRSFIAARRSRTA